MRRKQQQTQVHHDRWLVSYADFITLLFAFFVVMFASTQSDRNKAKAVSDSVREALEHGQFSTAISVVLGRGRHESIRVPPVPERGNDPENLPPKPEPPRHPPDLAGSKQTLEKGLAKELEAGKIELRLEARGLVISLREAAFFASGDDKVSPSSFPIMEKIANVIRDIPQPLRLEGYTDSIPIHTARFRSNWELSSARAIAMLELLRDRYQMPEDRMSVAGYAENAPADSNETEVGRAHNRRVNIVVLSLEGMKTEPTAK
jgi:chemotaxis protein MotB